MNYLLLILWPFVLAASCWLLRRSHRLVTLLVTVAAAGELVLVLRTPINEPVRLLGAGVLLNGFGQILLIILTLVIVIAVWMGQVFPQGEQTPAIALVLLSCGAAMALFNTPVLALLWLLIAGLLMVLLLVDQPPGSGTLLDPAVLAVALKFLVVLVFGCSLAFIGLMLGSVNPSSALAQGMILIGWAVMVGLVPFQLVWSSIAETTALPALSLICGGFQLLGALVILTIFDLELQLLSSPGSQQLLLVLGSLTVIGGGLLAVAGQARRSVLLLLRAQFGWIVLALSTAQVTGLVAAVVIISVHALGVVLSLISLAVLERRVPGRVETAGLLRERPLAAAGLIIGLLTLIGLPPLAGFVPLIALLRALHQAPFVLAAVGLGLLVSGWASVRLIRDLLLRPLALPTTRSVLYDEVQLLPAMTPPYAPAFVRGLIIVLITASVGVGVFPHLIFGALDATARFLPLGGG